MNFDKTSPKNRNPQQPKISRHATKKPAQLCGKTAQLATLLQEHVAKFGSALFCCWSLLRNNIVGTNLRRFATSYDSWHFAAYDC